MLRVGGDDASCPQSRNGNSLGIDAFVSSPEVGLNAIFSSKRLLACRATECHFEMSLDVSRHAATLKCLSAVGPLALDLVLRLSIHSVPIAEMRAYPLRMTLDPLTTGTPLFVPLALIYDYSSIGILFSFMSRLLLDVNNAVVVARHARKLLKMI